MSVVSTVRHRAFSRHFLFSGLCGLGALLSCATSDQSLEAKRHEAELQNLPSAKAECKPGVVEACYTGGSGTAGRGVCKDGKRTCDESGHWGVCGGEVVPARESCNAIDDDCDGIIDNGFERAGAVCFRGQGACRSQGTWQCAASGKEATCSAAMVAPSAEVCDGIDNDCNGVVDDGLVVAGETCSTGKPGVCNPGTKRCVAGTVRCVQNVEPMAEVCNNLDDNCNNLVDDACVKQ